jgi:hypothetical protein
MIPGIIGLEGWNDSCFFIVALVNRSQTMSLDIFHLAIPQNVVSHIQ